MKNILYVSSACSDDMFSYLESNRISTGFVYGMPVAANKFHNLIMQGFVSNNSNVSALVGLPVSFKSHKKKIWRKKKEFVDNVNFINLPFINFPFIKHFFIGISCFFNILKWSRGKKNKLIVFDAAFVSIIPFIFLANIFSKSKTIAIFSDIYNYMYDVEAKNTNYNLLGKISRRLMKHYYGKTYGYVFLSEQMNDLINKNNKPYCVIEGVASTKFLNQKFEVNKSKKNILFYAGALRKEYGLEILLNGFMKYKDKMAELWICGAGDYLDTIKELSLKDKRIKYKGVVSNAEAIEMEHQATLLINPRPSNLEFTQYSFPSKLMEYMSSGNSVLTTKLPTIPKDYYDYLFFIEDESSDGIVAALNNVLKKDDLKKFGLKTKKFIEENKTEIMQVKKIINICGDLND